MGRPVTKANGRIKPLTVLGANGKEEYHPEARYKLSWYESGKKRFEDVGQDTDVAVASLQRKETALAALASGLEIKGEGPDAEGRVLVNDAISVYLSDVKAGKAPKTFAAPKRSLELFRLSCLKTYMDQIGTRDMLDFKNFLVKQGFAARTVFNQFEAANSFLRANGIKDIVPKHEWPRFDQKPVKRYTQEQLTRLFAEADEDERLVFQFFLGSGAREGEVSRLTWANVDFRGKKVDFISQEGASTKTRKSRSVPLPDHLIASLRAAERSNGHSRYVFPNGEGGMQGHFLRILKMVAFRAGLNCGRCEKVGDGGKQNCRDSAVCGEWELHRFRKTSLRLTFITARISGRFRSGSVTTRWMLRSPTSRTKTTLRTRFASRSTPRSRSLPERSAFA